MTMFNPPHPGETLREDVLPALNLKIAGLARHLGYGREHLSRVLNARAPVSADLAVRLERAGIGRARTWLAVQADYDVWEAEQRTQPDIARLARAA